MITGYYDCFIRFGTIFALVVLFGTLIIRRVLNISFQGVQIQSAF